MNNIIMQLLYAVLKEVTLGVIITLCTIFSSFGQISQQQDIIDSNARAMVFTQKGVPAPTHESAPCFMPGCHTVYFAIKETIYVSQLTNGKWARPIVAPFSKKWGNWDPSLSPDGKRLIFVSDRPLEGTPQDTSRKNDHLWYIDHLSGNNWSKPKHFDAPVNLDGFNNYGPSISSSGTICFCSKGRDGNKGMCGYCAKKHGNHYDQPKLLALNGAKDIYDPFITADERYIIFVSDNELYISYRNGDGWSQGQKLGPQVNNGNANHDPYVSPDGKMLYYSQTHAPGILMIPINIPNG